MLEVILLFYKKEAKVKVYTLAKATVLWRQKLEVECKFAGHSLCLIIHSLPMNAVIVYTWCSNDSGQHKTLLCHKFKYI